MNKQDTSKQLKIAGSEIVTQSNFFINAPRRFTLLEYKLIAILVSKIRPEDTEFSTFRLTVKELATALKLPYNNNIYKELINTTGRLLSRIIKIHHPEKELFIQAHIIDSAHYWYGKGYVDIEISDKMKPYFLDLKRNFTQYKLVQMLALSSTHAVRIYELAKQYESTGIGIFSIDELKEKLGMKKTEHQNMTLFRTKVLEIAQREINAKTDININFNFQKSGRKITTVIFDIKPKSEKKEKSKKLYCINNEKDPQLVREIMQFGYSSVRASEMLDFIDNSDAESAITPLQE